MSSYAKLFSTITESSLWTAPKETRLLFVSMLAKANGAGFVEAAVPGLARMSNLSLEETERALAELQEPDPYSQSADLEGRRVLKVPGGWVLVNYEAYRLRRDEDARREYMRGYMREYRKRDVNRREPSLAKGEGEGEGEGEREGEVNSHSFTDAYEGEGQPSREERQRKALAGMGAKLSHQGEDLLAEWLGVVKGLKQETIGEIFAEAKPAIQWPSEFKAHRAARGNYG